MSLGNALEPPSSRDLRGVIADAIKSSPFGVIIVDSDFKLVHLSAQRAFSNVRPLLGVNFVEVARIVWPPGFADEVIGRFRHCLDSGEAFHASHDPNQSSGHHFDAYDWQLERISLPDGRAGVACQFYDLRDRQYMESVMRRSEQRFRMALDAANALVYEADTAGKVITYGLERVTGYRPEEVPLNLKWWYSLIHPDDLPRHQEKVERHLATGGSHTRTYRIRRNDEAWIWVEATAQVLRDASGNPMKVIGALVDITERKLATDAIHQSKQRFRTLHGLSGRLLAAQELTPALEDLLDCAMASCGAVYGLVQQLNPGMKTLEIVAHRGVEQAFLDQFRHVRADDSTFTTKSLESGKQVMIVDVLSAAEAVPQQAAVAATGCRAFLATPLKTHDGHVVGVLSIGFRDTYRVPEQDQQLLEIYARDGADFITRLRFEQALREAERNKDEFLAMLAHELRSPLAPLRTALELIRQAPGNLAMAEKACATMDRQLGQLKRLVDDLLDVSRIASQKLDLQLQDLDLAAVTHHAAEASQPMIDRRNQTLIIELPELPMRLHGDPARLAQVFWNLITNASKYSDVGSTIRVTAERDGNDIMVSVLDTGCGIPPEHLPRVFDLFMQIDQTSRRSGRGLGIGLSLVKRLVELHSGTVSAHSEGVGRGSRFVVRLPATGAPAGSERPHEPASGPARL
ncbi:hypothetical protein GCM10027034_19000 [Ramlibacter solisilvae]|uniref:PAS domain-containing sensor histidine kinase n=1 Tax=Ramlibacter tataouinensis TaxID=94132 RepID=UPI000776F8C5|nr:ATP-binding protein [Ramlibacter tataouinensis]